MGLAQLVTCIVSRDGAKWDVTWASDGKTPRDFAAAALDVTADQACAQVAAIYAGKKEAANAELQFAIYPWEGDAGDITVIYDITREGDELVATDIQGSNITFRGATLDELVVAGGRYVVDPRQAMFRWIRRVSELTT